MVAAGDARGDSFRLVLVIVLVRDPLKHFDYDHEQEHEKDWKEDQNLRLRQRTSILRPR